MTLSRTRLARVLIIPSALAFCLGATCSTAEAEDAPPAAPPAPSVTFQIPATPANDVYAPLTIFVTSSDPGGPTSRYHFTLTCDDGYTEESHLSLIPADGGVYRQFSLDAQYEQGHICTVTGTAPDDKHRVSFGTYTWFNRIEPNGDQFHLLTIPAVGGPVTHTADGPAGGL